MSYLDFFYFSSESTTQSHQHVWSLNGITRESKSQYDLQNKSVQRKRIRGVVETRQREGGLKKYKRERKRDRVGAEDGNDKRKKARGGNFVN